MTGLSTPPNLGLATDYAALPSYWLLADGADRNDISHRLSGAFRNLIAFFSYRTT